MALAIPWRISGCMQRVRVRPAIDNTAAASLGPYTLMPLPAMAYLYSSCHARVKRLRREPR